LTKETEDRSNIDRWEESKIDEVEEACIRI
jgi:hypothetical protein